MSIVRCQAVASNFSFPHLARSGNNIRADVVIIDLVRRQQSIGTRVRGVQEGGQWLERISMSTEKTVFGVAFHLPHEIR